MKPNFARAVQEAKRVRGDGFYLPVSIERLVAVLGIEIRFGAAPDDYSGAAIRTGSRRIIAVNSRDSYHRQRFTIAHELGHLTLHSGERYVDRAMVVGYRARHVRVTPEESEANVFAAEILMPEILVRQEAADVRTLSLEETIRHLASRFGVSDQAMAIRLSRFLDVLL